jgi:hypothetical protein
MTWDGLDSSGSGWGIFESSYKCCNEPSCSIKYWDIGERLHGLSSGAQLHRVRVTSDIKKDLLESIRSVEMR